MRYPRADDPYLAMPQAGMRRVKVVWNCPRCPAAMALTDLWGHLERVHGIKRSKCGQFWGKTQERLERAS